MARFRNRESGAVVGATRLRSAKQVETANRGWITAGANTWEVMPTIAGARPSVLTDQEFRAQYEPLDGGAEAALAAPGIGEQQLRHAAPAPPEHSARQALPKQKTAEDHAAEKRAQREKAIAEREASDDAGYADDLTGEPAAAPKPKPKPKRGRKNG